MTERGRVAVSLKNYINQAMSPWMKQEGPDSDIVLSSRVRLARNFSALPFPTIADDENAKKVIEIINREFNGKDFEDVGKVELVRMDELKSIEKRILVEKHLISPHLADDAENGGVLLTENEEVSIMVNEEDHIRIQCLFPGLQLRDSLQVANKIDNWLEEKVDYAFDENKGYLTSCPTNVGTGLRASVMMHLPALVMTQKINRILPAIHQLGLAVRGIYGEGSEALGNIFQISNQITLGKSEEDIIEDLRGVVLQVIEHERQSRESLLQSSSIQLEDRIWRSYGTLENSRIIQSKETLECLSDVRLGIDLGFIEQLSKTILSELAVLIQPGFIQHYSGEVLSPNERDIRRATIIRERLKMDLK